MRPVAAVNALPRAQGRRGVPPFPVVRKRGLFPSVPFWPAETETAPVSPTPVPTAQAVNAAGCQGPLEMSGF
jgi:hypothetical protein